MPPSTFSREKLPMIIFALVAVAALAIFFDVHFTLDTWMILVLLATSGGVCFLYSAVTFYCNKVNEHTTYSFNAIQERLNDIQNHLDKGQAFTDLQKRLDKLEGVVVEKTQSKRIAETNRIVRELARYDDTNAIRDMIRDLGAHLRRIETLVTEEKPSEPPTNPFDVIRKKA